MSRLHRLAGLRKRMERLESRIAADEAERRVLLRETTYLAAKIAVDAMPANVRNTLVVSLMPTNAVARKPVVR